MIHFTKEGARKKLGLNLYRSAGGFVAVWAWYDMARYEGISYRFRLRLHIQPRIMWEATRFNVIESYLMANDLELVHREVLEDLKAAEDQVKRTNEPYAYIKPV